MNVRRGFLLALIGLLLVLSASFIMPFLQYFLATLLLAFVLYPLQRRLEPRLGEGVAASVLIVGAVIAFFIPFIVIGATVSGDAMRLAQQAQNGELGGFSEFGVSQAESLIQQYTGQQVDLVSQASSYAASFAQTAAGSAPGVFSALTHLLVGLGLAVFVLFFLLKDGDKLYAWIRNITPMPEPIQDDFYTSLEDITWAVLLGHVLVAIVQGGIAGIGLFVTGIPNATLWTFLMIILSLIPIVGSFLIWGPAAIYLVATGGTVAGVALAVWGTIVVGATDDFLRPIVVDRHAKLNPSIIIVGVIGGVYVIGFMGLFVGPIIVGVLKVVLELFDDHYDDL